MSNVIVVSNREPYEHNLVDGRVVFSVLMEGWFRL